jgi:hypothetical protein
MLLSTYPKRIISPHTLQRIATNQRQNCDMTTFLTPVSPRLFGLCTGAHLYSKMYISGRSHVSHCTPFNPSSGTALSFSDDVPPLSPLVYDIALLPPPPPAASDLGADNRYKFITALLIHENVWYIGLQRAIL